MGSNDEIEKNKACRAHFSLFSEKPIFSANREGIRSSKSYFFYAIQTLISQKSKYLSIEIYFSEWSFEKGNKRHLNATGMRIFSKI